LAKLFGTTLAEIDKWVSWGAPYIKRSEGNGDAWEFDTADVSNWLVDRARRGLRPLLR
jgi:phage terminase Nu1 subunit (DNA packaging protein)